MKLKLVLKSPATAPSSATIMGVFGNRLFEFRGGLRFMQAARASSIATQDGEQHRKKR